MIKLVFIDIGELCWSLYLSAHFRWLRENTNYSLAVITTPDRKCLYKDLADLILDVPGDFYEEFGEDRNCFGVGYPPKKGVREYFQKMLPSGYVIPENFHFNGNLEFLSNKVIYKAYEYIKRLESKKKILIFPRYRIHPRFSYANLPKSFYIELIEILCSEFSNREIKTIGINSGAHVINEIRKNNYVNGVKENADLQDTIDECQSAVVAIGGVSSLPRLSLLQKVPTFIIGYQKKRFTEDDNWSETKAGFYRVARGSFDSFSFESCIEKIISFIKEVQWSQK